MGHIYTIYSSGYNGCVPASVLFRVEILLEKILGTIYHKNNQLIMYICVYI